MKVAHIAIVTPGRCGLYETTRELVVALRKRGVDSRLVDPTIEENTLYPGGTEDRGALFAGLEWAKDAAVLVNHSGLGKELEAADNPVVHVAHGRPLSSFMTEAASGAPIYSYHYRNNKAPRFKAVVTFWPEHEGYLKVMYPDKPVSVVPAPVDLEAWSPEGPNGYKFGGKAGKVNVVCTDAFRNDIDPFVSVNALALWARKHPGTKLHVYAKPKTPRGWPALLKRLQEDGTLGEVKGWIGGLSNVYRAADFLITPQEINTRSVREAMACGCPVARTRDLDPAPLVLAMATNRAQVRRKAEELFDPMRSAEAFAEVLQAAV